MTAVTAISCVLDAGVLVALFVPQPATDKSITFVSAALAQVEIELASPDCVFYEVAATLRKYERLGAHHDVDEDLLKLYEMPIAAVSCRELMQSAAIISREHVVSPYDAFYLALSQRDELPLVTADNRLANGVKGKGFDVRHVASLIA